MYALPGKAGPGEILKEMYQEGQGECRMWGFPGIFGRRAAGTGSFLEPTVLWSGTLGCAQQGGGGSAQGKKRDLEFSPESPSACIQDEKGLKKLAWH